MNHTILWRRLDLPGHEYFRLESVGSGWSLEGQAVFAFEGEACALSYRIRCAAAWRTDAADVTGWVGSRRIALQIEVTEDGAWTLNGAACPAVDGCIDIDLGFSPSTNLLPIRRLSLAVGESAEVRAAWLPFPGLAFEPLSQIYRRTGEETYRYESRGGAFTRQLQVNDAGIVTDYPGLWQREPPPDAGG